MQRLIDPHQAVEQLQQALFAASRLDLVVFVIAKYQPADPVIVFQRRPADQRGRLSREYRLEHQAGAEEQPSALLHQNEDGPLAFLMEQLGVRLLRACRHAPVDAAHVVSGLIDPHLIEVHATTAQLGMVQADQRAALAGGRKQLHFPHPMTHLDQLAEADADARLGDQVGLHGVRRRPRRRGCAESRDPDRYRQLRPRTTG